MYERYCILRDSKNIKDADVARNTGIPKSTFSDWKSGKSIPKYDKLIKIANFFGVSVEYLKNGFDNKYSDENVLLDIRISEDFELKEAIKKYYSLNDKKKKHVIELINLLSGE